MANLNIRKSHHHRHPKRRLRHYFPYTHANARRLQRRLAVRRHEDLTPLFAACTLFAACSLTRNPLLAACLTRYLYAVALWGCFLMLCMTLACVHAPDGRKDGGIQRRLAVRRHEDLTPLFAACPLTPLLAACLTRYSDVTPFAAFACAAGRLVNSKNNSVERNGGSFQRRLQLEHRRSALKPSLPCHPQTPRAPVHAYACLRTRQFKAARQLDERANCCKRSFLKPSLVYFKGGAAKRAGQ